MPQAKLHRLPPLAPCRLLSLWDVDFMPDGMRRIVVLDHRIRALLGTARFQVQPLARHVALLITLRQVTDVPEEGRVTLLRPRERDLEGRSVVPPASLRPVT
jgi:hypothetical protein